MSAFVCAVTVKTVVAYRAVRSDHLDTAETDRIANKNFEHSARRGKKSAAEHKGEEEIKRDYERFIARDMRVCAG